jgi:hypothetical protein
MATREHPRNVVWVPNAYWMFDEAVASIAERSPNAVEQFVEDVLRAADILERYADDGLVVREVGRDDVREIMIGRYRLQYLLEPDTAQILALAHEA